MISERRHASAGTQHELGSSFGRSAVRFREDRPAELVRARVTVANWRDQNPAGTAEELIAAIGHRFHRDYAVVLRAVLFAVDRHRARQVTGLTVQENGQ
jgi:hypothetical protein